MKKILFLCFFLILIKTSEDDGKTEADIIKESQYCGEHRFDFDSCTESSNCVYLEWFINELNTQISFCFSYSEIMKYFIGEPEEYLEKENIKNHNTINKSNFCDVIDDTRKFLNIDGEINLCKVSLL